MLNKDFNNILVIDDSDSPVNYSKSELSSNAIHTVTTYQELFEVFMISPESIFGCCTKDVLTFILSDNTEISLHEYKSNDKPVFLKISEGMLKQTGNDILISLETGGIHRYSRVMPKNKWQTNLTGVQKSYIQNRSASLEDIDGYKHCQDILRNASVMEEVGKLPAIMFACNKQLVYNGKTYKGYIPALGQLAVIHMYFNIIAYILKKFKIHDLDINTKYWSSSEFSYSSVLTLIGSIPSYTIKDDKLKSLVLYKQID